MHRGQKFLKTCNSKENPISVQNGPLNLHWIAVDPASRGILQTCLKVKDTSATLLIQGESGTGKDLLAGILHHSSSRRDEPFLKIDASSLPAELMESELFGYEKGAFTGAYRRKEGKLEFAGQGTLVLDGLAELPLDTQAKLLRVIEEKSFERLGGRETVQLKARIVALAAEDLKEAVRVRRFREDLYFRLSVVPLVIPPLRDRRADIQPLVEHFIQSKRTAAGQPLKLSEDALRRLMAYHYPGNVRELKNLIDRAAALAETDFLEARHFPAALLSGDPSELFAGNPSLEEIERRYIALILESTHGRKGKAAAILGISRKTLLEKRKRYGLMG
ncbi:MAG: sigma-54 dependent transcriptional regulator [Acidobacteriota bacterium]